MAGNPLPALPAMPAQSTSGITSTQGQVGISGGNQTGSTNNTQTTTGTQTQSNTGSQNEANVYHPWQDTLQQTAGDAAGNYITSGQPPPTVLGADDALKNAYVSQYNQTVAPQIAAAQGPGSAQLGSQLALGLEQLDAGVYNTNLNAYQNAINQGSAIGFNAIGQTGAQGQTSTGTSSQTGTSKTNQTQDWQQAQADLSRLVQSSNSQSL